MLFLLCPGVHENTIKMVKFCKDEQSKLFLFSTVLRLISRDENLLLILYLLRLQNYNLFLSHETFCCNLEGDADRQDNFPAARSRMQICAVVFPYITQLGLDSIGFGTGLSWCFAPGFTETHLSSYSKSLIQTCFSLSMSLLQLPIYAAP